MSPGATEFVVGSGLDPTFLDGRVVTIIGDLTRQNVEAIVNADAHGGRGDSRNASEEQAGQTDVPEAAGIRGSQAPA